MTYWEWLVHIVQDDAHPAGAYSRVLRYLRDRQFYWVNPYDRNRESDGLYLRSEYEYEAEQEGDEPVLDAPAWSSVLEVIVALAVRCESSIMYDPDEGDRTSLWFWSMLRNLRLDVPNQMFNEDEACSIIDRLLEIEYEPNGVGGLFPVANSRYDMREMDIWAQMGYWLNRMYPM